MKALSFARLFQIATPLFSALLLASFLGLPSLSAADLDLDTNGMPLVMPGYASLEGYRLSEPGSQTPLTSRFLEVITVVGEIDPPYSTGDDRIDLVNPEYNEKGLREYMGETPGLVTATMTIWIEEVNKTDNKVQLWESVFVRCYNNDKKEDATHYCDTTPWKAQPGFNDIVPEQNPFGEWKKIPKHAEKTTKTGD